MKNAKRALALLLSLSLLLSLPVLPGFVFTASGSASVFIAMSPGDTVAAAGEDATLTLTVEGLGCDPADNSVANISFSSSDSDVAQVVSRGSGTVYTPPGYYEPTGLEFTVSVSAISTGAAVITAEVTDIGGERYTCTANVIVKGLLVSPKSVTLEAGEARVLSARVYGFTQGEAASKLRWTKDGDLYAVTMGVHNQGGMNITYYVKGNAPGSVTVTVSSADGLYSDTVDVTVLPAKTLTVNLDGVEVTEPVDLSTGAQSAVLEAVTDGFDSPPEITWESSNPDIVSVTSANNNSAVITRQAYSETTVAIEATAVCGDVIRRKTVCVTTYNPDYNASLKICSSVSCAEGGDFPFKAITLTQGETFTLSALTRGTDASAVIWSASTDGGRVPVLLNSTVGGVISLTARSATSEPVAVTAQAGGLTDTVYITVLPDSGKYLNITGAALGADGVMVLEPNATEELRAEAVNFTPGAEIIWEVSIAANSSADYDSEFCPVTLDNNHGNSVNVTADEPSTDFAKVTASVSEGNTRYTDTIYVKVNEQEIIKGARFISVPVRDKITLQTENGLGAEWVSESPKAYLGATQSSSSSEYGSSAGVTAGVTTSLPVKITADQEQCIDSVYVNVTLNYHKTVYFDLNGGIGTAPRPVCVSANDKRGFAVLSAPDAVYPADDGEYVFAGWSTSPSAGVTTSNALIYRPGETYEPSTTADDSVILYAVWAKKTQGALFKIRIGEGFPAEPSSQPLSEYTKAGIYMENAPVSSGFYLNYNGVESHLAAVPSDAEIANLMNLESIQYNPDTDRIVWYVIKRANDDAAGLPCMRVDGLLIKGGRVSIEFNKNTSAANVIKMPNPYVSVYETGSVVSIPDSYPLRNGSSFVGWNKEPDGSGQWFSSTGSLYNGFTPPDGENALTSIILTEDTTLYAIWSGINIRAVCSGGTMPDEINVTFAGNNYTLNEYNGMTVSVGSFAPDYLIPAENPVPGGFRLSVETNVLYGNSDTSVIYTLKNERVYTVLFSNYDGTELQRGEYAAGETPAYTGDTPVKPVTDGYCYSFEGWSPEIAPVTGDTVYTAAFQPLPAPALYGYSLTLGGDIGVNFYLDPGDYADGAYAEFTVGGKTQTVALDPENYRELDSGKKVFRFTCGVVPSQTGERITGAIYAPPYTLPVDYSVYDYLTSLADDPEFMRGEDIEDLAKAIATYGFCSNELFETDAALERHALYDDSGFDGITAQSLAEFAHSTSETAGEITCAGSSLVLLAKTSLRHYFNLPEGRQIDDYTFILGEGEDAVPLTPCQNGDKYFVEIPDIPSALLGEKKTVTVLDSGGTAVCTRGYSPMSYACAVLEKYEAGDETVSAKLVSTVRALTLYYYAARYYFALHGEDGGTGSSGGISGGLDGLIGGGGQISGPKGTVKSVSKSDITIISGDSRTLQGIYDVVYRNAYALKSVYGIYLRQNSSLEGTVTVQITIAPGGEVINSSVISSDTGLASFDRAVLNKTRQWTWSKVHSGDMTVSFPLTFVKAG